MRRLVLVVLIAASVAMTGCSGSSTSADPPGTTAAPATTSRPAPTKSEICNALIKAEASALVPMTADTLTKAQLDKAVAAIDDAKGSVPDNLRKDLETIGAGIRANMAVPSKVFGYANSKEFLDAAAEVNQYFSKNCAPGP